MIGVLAGVAIGLVFVVSGVLKLVAGPGWTKQAADMGVPRPVAVGVPYVEIVVGVLVATQLFTPWPAVVAVVLLCAFTVVILLRILDHSRPPCGCFGTRSQRPLGAYHVVRNLGDARCCRGCGRSPADVTSTTKSGDAIAPDALRGIESPGPVVVGHPTVLGELGARNR